MLLHGHAQLLGVFDQRFLVIRNDHVIDADGKAGFRGIAEPEIFDLVQHLDRGFEAKTQIAVGHQLSDALLLEQPVDERHAFRKVIVQNGAADGRVQETALRVHRFGVNDFLIVVCGDQVNHFTRITQPDGTQRFHFAGLERQQHFFDVGKGPAFALRTRLALGQVVDSQHHILGRNRNRLSGRGR